MRQVMVRDLAENESQLKSSKPPYNVANAHHGSLSSGTAPDQRHLEARRDRYRLCFNGLFGLRGMNANLAVDTRFNRSETLPGPRPGDAPSEEE